MNLPLHDLVTTKTIQHEARDAFAAIVLVRGKRSLYLMIGLAVIICSANSAHAQWFKRLGGFNAGPPSDPVPVAFNGPPTQADFLIWQQRHTANVNQLDAKIQVALTGTPKLRGTIQIELPRRLRLKAGVLGMNEMGVDVGSNDDLFWIWTRVALPGQSPTLMYANHQQFKQSSGAIRQAVPLEPEWLIDALGLVDFARYQSHSEPTVEPGGRMKMISGKSTPDGKQYRVTLFDAKRGIIEQQSLYDQRGTLIAYTDMSNYQYYPQHRVSLPRKIEMHLFQNGQEVSLTVTTDAFKINALYGDPVHMWTMPDPTGVQKIDIAPAASMRSAQPRSEYSQPVQRTPPMPGRYLPASQSSNFPNAQMPQAQLPDYSPLGYGGEAKLPSSATELPALRGPSLPAKPQRSWQPTPEFRRN